MLLGLLIFPVVLILAIPIPGHVARCKQVTFDRARASLLAALSDTGSGAMLEPKRYGYFQVYATTNMVTVGGTSYALAFCTAEEYQFANKGRLAVTTNRQFVWLDYHRGAKVISDDYKVSKWRTGY
jgi:hypothetical protein